jgi:hypothetical protein
MSLIHPGLGLGRAGDSPTDWFIAPETSDAPPVGAPEASTAGTPASLPQISTAFEPRGASQVTHFCGTWSFK